MSLSAIWHLFSGIQKAKMVGLLLLMLVGVGLETIGVGMMFPLMASLVQKDYFFNSYLPEFLKLDLDQSTQQEIVFFLVSSMFVLFSIKNIFLGYLAYLQSVFTFGLRRELSNRLYMSYLRQPYESHLLGNTSERIQIVQDETMQIAANFLIPFLLLLTESLIFICIVAVVISTISGFNIVALFVPVFGLMIVYLGIRKRIVFWGERRNHHEAMRIKNLQHGFGGIRDIKIMQTEEVFLDRFDNHNKLSAKFLTNIQVSGATPRLLFEVLGVMGLLLMVYFNWVFGVSADVFIVELGMFGVALLRLAPSGARILSALQKMRSTNVSSNLIGKEIGTFSDKRGRSEESCANPLPITFEEEIKVDSISYRYNRAEEMVLADISLVIKRGERVGVVGPSGSGKSTFLNVLLGLLSPVKGKVLSDGKNIQENLVSWRNKIGYVPQQVYLSDDTLRRNIAFGIEDCEINDQLIDKVVEMASLAELVNSSKLGLDNIVGERGGRLSGGQQQRIGLARALYRQPSILILDEVTSALDEQTENTILRAINKLKDNITVIVVSHKASTLSLCDSIYEIKDSNIKAIK
jgi:ABC-type multidrug transport system fused ATPase/permease subunit